jgi:hypothetical protein
MRWLDPPNGLSSLKSNAAFSIKAASKYSADGGNGGTSIFIFIGLEPWYMVQIMEEGLKPTLVRDVALRYKLVPFAN